VFDSEINVGNHGDDKGHDPELIGRNTGKRGMGGPGTMKKAMRTICWKS
jgi:hypothetical protein